VAPRVQHYEGGRCCIADSGCDTWTVVLLRLYGLLVASPDESYVETIRLELPCCSVSLVYRSRAHDWGSAVQLSSCAVAAALLLMTSCSPTVHVLLCRPPPLTGRSGWSRSPLVPAPGQSASSHGQCLGESEQEYNGLYNPYMHGPTDGLYITHVDDCSISAWDAVMFTSPEGTAAV
jgi:hypothetical protein